MARYVAPVSKTRLPKTKHARARARRARALGPGALGPEGLGPWALGPLALGAWARARGVPTAPLPGARGPASPPRGTGLWRQGRARATPHPCQPPRGSGKGSRGQLARGRGSPPRLASPRAARPVPRAPARGPGSPPRAPGGWGELPPAGQACPPPARARTGRGARLEALPAPRVLPVPRVREARRGWWQPDAPRAAGELLCFPHFAMIMESFPHGIIPVKSIIFL